MHKYMFYVHGKDFKKVDVFSFWELGMLLFIQYYSV